MEGIGRATASGMSVSGRREDDLRAGSGPVVLVYADEHAVRIEDPIRAGDAGGAERPTVGGREGLIGIEVQAREVAEGRVERQGRTRPLRGNGVLDLERADRRPAEGGQVGAAVRAVTGGERS